MPKVGAVKSPVAKVAAIKSPKSVKAPKETTKVVAKVVKAPAIKSTKEASKAPAKVVKNARGAAANDHSKTPLTATVSTVQAARIIGCSTQHVRNLVIKGLIKCKKHNLPSGRHYYEIDRVSAEKYRDTPQTTGFPRGGKRNNRAEAG